MNIRSYRPEDKGALLVLHKAAHEEVGVETPPDFFGDLENIEHVYPQADMIVGLHHVQLTIPKGAEAQARDFYCRVLGLSEMPKPAPLVKRGGFWLQLGNCDIHIGTEDNLDHHNTKAHLAYEVNDFTSWRGRLEREGTTVTEGLSIPGFKRFEFRDPFGNRVEMIERIA